MLVLGAWALLLVGARLWGLQVVAGIDANLGLHAVPWYGEWRWSLTWWLLAPVTVGALSVALLPGLCRRQPWRVVLAVAAGAGVLLSLALAVAETHPAAWQDIHRSYGRHVDIVDQQGVGRFLRDYTDSQRIPGFPVHLQAHPPGLVMVLWAASRLGLSGPWFENTLAMVGVGAAIVAVLAILREVAGERAARAAAPFLAVAPAAVWHTNGDVIFGGVALAGAACLILAIRRPGRRISLAVTGGALCGTALMLSFGVALLAVPVLVVGLWPAPGPNGSWAVRLRMLGIGAAVTAAVVFLPLAWGYSWLESLEATRDRYYGGVGGLRSYEYSLVANLAVFALAVGPATAVALSRLRDRRVWIVVGSGLAVVMLANLSGLSSGETERIWQPFMPLVLLAGAALSRDPPEEDGERSARGWLTLQLAVTLILAAALRVQW